MWTIFEGTVEDIIGAARNVYPKEFISLLGGDKKKKVIDELIVQPAEFGDGFSYFKDEWNHPWDARIVGSVHSHPSPSNWPSHADLHAFEKSGKIHLIIAYPYNEENIRAYDRMGKDLSLRIK